METRFRTAYAPYFRAWHTLCHVARLEQGDVLFVNGASSAVGLAAVEIGRMKGARVFATVPHGEPHDALLARGVEGVERVENLDGPTTIREKAGRVDVVLNAVDGSARSRSMLALRPGGWFLDLAPTGNLGLGGSRSITYAAMSLEELSVERPERYATVTREVLSALAGGSLRLIAPKVVSARDVASLAAPSEAAWVVLDLANRDISIRESAAQKPLFRAAAT